MDLAPVDCVNTYDGFPMGLGTDCATTTCPQPGQACCLPDGVCLDNVLPQDCIAQGGMPQPVGETCAGFAVACCLPDGSCADLDPLCCESLGGVPGFAPNCLGDLNGDGIDEACQQDVDGDGVPDGVDQCNNTPPATAVDLDGRPLGDVDQDCDTDLVDYALMMSGFTGPLN
jgi:hypothetical protein